MLKTGGYSIVGQAEAVRVLREQLAALGSGDDAEVFDLAVESETTFKEVVEALLDEEATAKAFVAALEEREGELNARRKRLKRRIETIRALIASGMQAAEVHSLRTATATVSLVRVAPKAIVMEEGDIPARFWRPQAPKLNQLALTKALCERDRALREVGAIPEAREREAALTRIERELPAVPGAALTNGSMTIAISRG